MKVAILGPKSDWITRGDHIIEVTAQAGSTVHVCAYMYMYVEALHTASYRGAYSETGDVLTKH